MSGNRMTPWWYSGGDEPESTGPADGATPDGATDDGAATASGAGLGDWSSLLAGAVRMVDWATSTVMAPHAEHDDPAEHPTCVVCRTIALVGDPTGLATSAGEPGSTGAAATERPEPPVIRWIPIEDESADADS